MRQSSFMATSPPPATPAASASSPSSSMFVSARCGRVSNMNGRPPARTHNKHSAFWLICRHPPSLRPRSLDIILSSSTRWRSSSICFFRSSILDPCFCICSSSCFKSSCARQAHGYTHARENKRTKQTCACEISACARTFVQLSCAWGRVQPGTRPLSSRARTRAQASGET